METRINLHFLLQIFPKFGLFHFDGNLAIIRFNMDTCVITEIADSFLKVQVSKMEPLTKKRAENESQYDTVVDGDSVSPHW